VDISRDKPKKINVKKYAFWGVVLSLSVVATNYLLFLGEADFSVDSETLVYDQVKRGKFSVSVRGTGQLVPDNIEWLSANIEARVERVVVKAGKFVKKGDLIVELSNPKLEQLLEETQWELEARLWNRLSALPTNSGSTSWTTKLNKPRRQARVFGYY